MFKVGDRVKVIADEDGLGVLGQSGKISHQASDKVWVVDLGGSTVAVFDHEIQLIPLAVAGQFESASEIQKRQYDTFIEASKSRDEALFGEGTESETGSLRYNTGKPMMSLVTPEFILGMAEVLTKGAKKYGERNWELGNKTSVPYDSAMRHILAWRSGESFDEESGSHHLFHGAVNLLMCWYYEQNFGEMDDR